MQIVILIHCRLNLAQLLHCYKLTIGYNHAYIAANALWIDVI